MLSGRREIEMVDKYYIGTNKLRRTFKLTPFSEKRCLDDFNCVSFWKGEN